MLIISMTDQTKATKGATKPKVSYVKDIQLMMFGMGDYYRPRQCTAFLIEEIVLDQLKHLIQAAYEISRKRGQHVVGPEDILFVLRNNLPALKRLITYLGIKDEKVLFCKALSELAGLEDLISSQDDIPERWIKSRKTYCLEFLKTIEIDEADLASVEDGVKLSRLKRADEMAKNLSHTEYEEFHKARCASFSSPVFSDKFENWLRQGGITQAISFAVFEILGYLAKEAVANLVDMAFSLRPTTDVPLAVNRPITEEEILEVVRRCTYQQTIPTAAFETHLPINAHTKLFVF